MKKILLIFGLSLFLGMQLIDISRSANNQVKLILSNGQTCIFTESTDNTGLPVVIGELTDRDGTTYPFFQVQVTENTYKRQPLKL